MKSRRIPSRPGSAVLAVAATVSLFVSGCSTGSGGSQNGPSTEDLAKIPAEVKQGVTTAMAPPEFKAPGAPIDVSGVKGKTIFVIPQVANPFHQSIVEAMGAAATKAGAKLTVYPTQGQPSQWVQGMNAALSAKVDAINLVGIDPRLLQPQLTAAKRAGIPVISTHIYDNTAPEPPKCEGCAAGVTALVPGPFNDAAQAAADWIILNSGGKGNVLIVGAPDVPVSPPAVEVIKQRFAKHCPGCKTTLINIPAADWNTKVQGEVQTALTRDPGITYVYPLYDAMVAGTVPAIRAAGKSGQIKVVSYNGSTFALKFIQDRDIVAMDVGEDSVGIGYASMDQTFRVLLGEPVVKARTPIRIWDATNVSESGTPPVTGKGYGTALKTGYEKLWGLG